MHSCLNSANSTMYRSGPPAALACWTLDSDTVLPFALGASGGADAAPHLVTMTTWLAIVLVGPHGAVVFQLTVLLDVAPRPLHQFEVLAATASARPLSRRGIITPASS